jgi:sortase A
VGAGGLKAYIDTNFVPEPPPPVGVVESTLPPSLEDNPLPFTGDQELAEAEAGETGPAGQSFEGIGSSPAGPSPAESGSDEALTPTPSPVSTEAAPGAEPPGQEVFQEAEGDVPAPTPTPLPPLTSTPDPSPAAVNPPARIVAPAIQLDGEVVPVGWKGVSQGDQTVGVWEVAEYAAGWHKNSALPGGAGNIVLSGHHNIKGEIFRYIVDLKPGDAITLFADGRPYTYTVQARFILEDKGVSDEQRRENARWIGPFPDERLTLVTCWPYTNNTHRVIVIAKPRE